MFKFNFGDDADEPEPKKAKKEEAVVDVIPGQRVVLTRENLDFRPDCVEEGTTRIHAFKCAWFFLNPIRPFTFSVLFLTFPPINHDTDI
jgi:hypothetical protein